MHAQVEETAGDLYQTLGVAPGADARAVKLAYFALVRRFPPETHPEEFRRIREAYEVLSDPEQRAYYDAWRSSRAEELAHGPELEALRQGFLQARAQGALEAARRHLERTLELAPGRHAARHALALLLLDLGKWAEAEAELRRVLQATQDSVELRCDLIRALSGAGRWPEVEPELARARALAGGDADAHVRLAETLMRLARHATARDEVREAMRLDGGARPAPGLVRLLARVSILEHDEAGAAEVLVAAARDWAAEEGPARRDALATLAGGAAALFEAGHSAAANQVLAFCAAADPGCCPPPVPFPVELRREELPPATRRWIEAQRRTPQVPAEHYRPNTRDVKLTLGALLAFGLVFSLALLNGSCRYPLLTRRFIGIAMFLWVVMGVAVGMVWWMVRTRYSPFGTGMVLHPLHLLVVRQDRVRVIPLLRVRTAEVNPGRGAAELRIFTDEGLDASGFVFGGRLVEELRRQAHRVLVSLSRGELHLLQVEPEFPPALFRPRTAWRELTSFRPLRVVTGAAVGLVVAVGMVYAMRTFAC